MNYNPLKAVAVTVVTLTANMLLASPTSEMIALRTPRSGEVEAGVWHADLEKCKAYATANGMPLIAVWSNGEECSHCLVFEQMCLSPVFREWMPKSGFVFYFGVRDDGPTGPTADGQEGYHGTSFYWCRMRNGGYDPYADQNWPYVRVYWPQGGVDQFFTGAALTGEWLPVQMPASKGCQTKPEKFQYAGDDGTYNPSARYFADKLTNKGTGVLRNYSPVPAYNGGEFYCPNVKVTTNAGLQVERGSTLTKFIVPLSRTNVLTRASEGFNYLLAIFPNGRTSTTSVNWTPGQSTQEVSIDFDSAWLEPAAKPATAYGLTGTPLGITFGLYSKSVERKDVTYALTVDKVPNSPKNPLWIGTRSADALAWGEWTMDIDTARMKVAAAAAQGDSRAYTLVLVGGPLWCPDCVNLEEYLIDTDEFRAWATNNNHIACVAVDVPRIKDGSTTPTLLSHLPYTSARYGVVSGSGYLSRNGISAYDASNVLTRNLGFVNNDTDHGGLCLPEPASSTMRKTSGWKTGVPCLLLLRPDGSVAGRIYQFSNDTSALDAASAPRLVQRLQELVAQADEVGEERNDSLFATTSVIGKRELTGLSATLSFIDQADYYRIDAGANTTVYLNLKPTPGSTPTSNTITLSVIDGSQADPDAMPVTNVTAQLKNGISDVACVLPSGNCYVKVWYPLKANGYPEDAFFDLEKDGSTLCAYTLYSDSVVYPEETFDFGHPWVIADCADGCSDLGEGVTNVWVTLEKDQEYRFSGLDDASAVNTAALDYNADTGLYTAKVSGGTKLALVIGADGKVTFGYQRWNPGVVGFVNAEGAVKEGGNEEADDIEFSISVRRSDGVSGWGGALLTLDREKSTQLTTPYYEFPEEGVPFVWEEGSNGVATATVTIKADTFADGEKHLFFKLTALPDEGDVAYASVIDEAKSEFVLTIEDDDAAVEGVSALTGVCAPDEAEVGVIPGSRKVVVKGGTSQFGLQVKRLIGTAGGLRAALYCNDDLVEEVSWEGRDNAPKMVYIDVPDYQVGTANRMQLRLDGVGGSKVDADLKFLVIEIIPADTAAFAETVKTVEDYVRYVRHEEVVLALDESTLVSDDVEVVKVSGSVAPGMSWKYDAGKGLVVSGVPTLSGVYTAVFQVLDAGVAGGTAQVTLTVADPVAPTESAEALNPSLANTRTVSDIMVVDDDKERLIGLLTVSVPPSGRLSARYRSLAANDVSLLSTAWDSCKDGTYTATLVGVQDERYVATVVAKADGAIEVDFTDPSDEYRNDSLICLPRSSDWTRMSAEPWRGYYTVSLPFKKSSDANAAFANGHGYVTLRMTDANAVAGGRMTYAGMLPNGKSFSGVSVLEAGSKTEALLPFYCKGEVDTVTGVLDINQNPDIFRWEVGAYENAYPYWMHQEILDEASYSGKLEAYGCLYNVDELVKCCTNTFATQYIFMYAQPEKLVRNDSFAIAENPAFPVAWDTNNIYSIGVKVYKDGMGASAISLYDPATCQREKGLTLAFNPNTGIVSGALWLDFYESKTPVAGTRVTASYRGVALPGWGKRPGSCSECSEPGPDLHPFISGACWFADTFEYDSPWGVRHLQIKRGCPFSIGVEPGK